MSHFVLKIRISFVSQVLSPNNPGPKICDSPLLTSYSIRNNPPLVFVVRSNCAIHRLCYGYQSTETQLNEDGIEENDVLDNVTKLTVSR